MLIKIHRHFTTVSGLALVSGLFMITEGFTQWELALALISQLNSTILYSSFFSGLSLCLAVLYVVHQQCKTGHGESTQGSGCLKSIV